MNPTKIYDLLKKLYYSTKRSILKFNDGDFTGLAAQVSFYLLSSLFPMVIMIFTAASAISLNYTDIMFKVLAMLPRKVEILLVNMLRSHGESATVIILTALLSIYTMAGVILTVEKGLIRFYKLKYTRNFVKSSLIAVIFAILIFAAIIASFGLIIFGRVIGGIIFKYVPGQEAIIIWNLSRYILVFVFIAFAISALYKALPTIKLKIREVLPGAMFTTVAWYAASMFFAMYVNNFGQYEIIYGSLAGFVCIIVWVYMTGVIILAGGKINALLYQRKLKKLKNGKN